MGLEFGVVDVAGMLLRAGFFSAFGTTEYKDGAPSIVTKGPPVVWDFDQGVTAIYDYQGRPWIKQGFHPPESPEVLGDIGTDFRRGAQVPHSNDGGRFVRMIASL